MSYRGHFKITHHIQWVSVLPGKSRNRNRKKCEKYNWMQMCEVSSVASEMLQLQEMLKYTVINKKLRVKTF